MASLSSTEQAALIATAHAMADAARRAILPWFRATGLLADNKLAGVTLVGGVLESGFDPVTQADRAAEQAMRDILARQRPQDSIIGEEFGLTTGSSELTWVLDPIDGTRAFLSGAPTWGVLIAVSDADGPLFGIIDQPYIGERFWGGFGQSAMRGPLGDATLGVRGTRALRDSILFTTFPELGSTAEAAGFRAVADRVQLVRYGMDCYAYALLAAGQIDLVIEAGLSNYDVHAPIAVITAAGGIVTDWQGGPAHHGGRVLAAAGAEQHAAALALLSQVPA